VRTIAGNGHGGWLVSSGILGGSALKDTISLPYSVAADTFGNVYVVDIKNVHVRKIDAHGVITNFAAYPGWSNPVYSGEDTPAVYATFQAPQGIGVDRNNNVLVCDGGSEVLRQINTSGIMTTIAGIHDTHVFNGDGIAATSASLNGCSGVYVDINNNILIADANTRIRKITPDGIIHTIAGNDSVGYFGNGAAATIAIFDGTQAVCTDPNGNIYIIDANNDVIRKVNATTNIVTLFAGTYGVAGSTGDGGLATSARLNGPTDIKSDRWGNIYIADAGNNKIRKVDTTGHISTFAGTGVNGFFGDGGAPNLAKFSVPSGIWIDTAGNFFIADKSSGVDGYGHRVREIFKQGTLRVNGSALHDSICAGTAVTFTAQTNITPFSAVYQWTVNGVHIGPNAPSLILTTINNGDVVKCALVDTNEGLNIQVATPDSVTMTVSPINYPSLSVSLTADTVCYGIPVTFTASPVNTGASAIVNWKLYGATLDTGLVFTYVPHNGDPVKCLVTSTIACSVPDSVDTTIVMTATPSYPPTIVLHASPSDTLAYWGQIVDMVSDVTYGGSAPTYQWFKNGVLIPGATTNSYSATFYESDSFYCVLTSNAPCAVPLTDTSNIIFINSGLLDVSTVSGSADGFSIAPQPSNGTFDVILPAGLSDNGTATISIRDLPGRLLYQTSMNAGGGSSKLPVHVPDDLVSGIYYLTVSAGTTTRTLPLTIRR